MLKNLVTQIIPFDHDTKLLNEVKAEGLPRLDCRPFPFTAIIAGKGTRVNDEIKIDQAQTDAVPIFRRNGGGCSVLLDSGNLVVSVAFPAEGYLNIQLLFQRATDWLIQGLKQSGIDKVYMDGISDLVIDNKKIGGSCFHRTKGFAHFSAAILVNADLNKIEKYLHFPPRQPAYRKGRSHQEFVVNLSSLFKGLTMEDLAGGLKQNLDAQALSG